MPGLFIFEIFNRSYPLMQAGILRANVQGNSACEDMWRAAVGLILLLMPSLMDELRRRSGLRAGGCGWSKGQGAMDRMQSVKFTYLPAIMAGDDRPRRGDDDNGTAVITRTNPKTKRPNLYRVLLMNDDYTPMEFVVHVLKRFFNKNEDEAHRIMLHVHHQGVGECGVFTYEVAETKVTQVMDFARKNQHPLQCVMEKN